MPAMNPFSNIDRVETISPKNFFDDYILPARPLIIEDSLCGRALHSFAHKARLPKRYLHSLIPLSYGFGNFLDQQNRALTEEECAAVKSPPCVTLSDYLNEYQTEKFSGLYCNEVALPKAILSDYSRPKLTELGLLDDVDYRFFVGGEKNYAHLHFDGDLRHVLFHQLLGEKTIVLIPISSTDKLLPVAHWSGHCLQNFSNQELNDFVHYVGGSCIKLSAGETLYFPAGIWHFVRYESLSISIACRFGRTQKIKFLGNNVHKNDEFLKIFSQLSASQYSNSNEFFEVVTDNLIKSYSRFSASSSEKVSQMNQAYRSIAAQYGRSKSELFLPFSSEFSLAIQSLYESKYAQHVDQMLREKMGWISAS